MLILLLNNAAKIRKILLTHFVTKLGSEAAMYLSRCIPLLQRFFYKKVVIIEFITSASVNSSTITLIIITVDKSLTKTIIFTNKLI